MAKQRDYRAEYARRIALASERGEARSEGRGHGLARAAERARGGVARDRWNDVIQDAIAKMGKTRTLRLMQQKARAQEAYAGKPSNIQPGRDFQSDWSEVLDEYDIDDGDVLIFYHAD